MPGGHPRCGRHQNAAAVWRCQSCARNLCEDCAAAVAAGRGEIVVCAFCGSLAPVITLPRAEVAPFGSQVRAAIAEALTAKALALAAIVTCASQSLAWMGKDWWVAGNALVLGWMLLCCRVGARGFPPFGRPTYAELGAALGAPLARLAASAGGLALAAFWLVDGGQRSAPAPAAIVVAVLAIALLPAAMIDAALEQSDRAWLLPWTVPAFEARVGKDIRPIRLAVVAFALFALAQAMLAPPDFRGDTNLTAHLAVSASLRFGAVVALAILASMTGRLVFTRAEEFGHGDPETYALPAFPEARPRGSRLNQG